MWKNSDLCKGAVIECSWHRPNLYGYKRRAAKRKRMEDKKDDLLRGEHWCPIEFDEYARILILKNWSIITSE